MIPKILITGASSGLGLAFAEECSSRGHDVVLVARSKEKLEAVQRELEQKYNITAHVIVQDLSVPGFSIQILEELRRLQISVDVVINNAGFAVYGPFYKKKLEEELSTIDVNIRAVTELTHTMLPQMLERKKGKILNISSTAAFQPGPLMAVYCASKAYVLSFSEALSSELKGTGVTVTALCPGVTWTGFQERGGIMNTRLVKHGNPMSAKEVAREGYVAVMENRTLVIPGVKNKVLAFGTRLLPRWMVLQVSKWTLEETR